MTHAAFISMVLFIALYTKIWHKWYLLEFKIIWAQKKNKLYNVE